LRRLGFLEEAAASVFCAKTIFIASSLNIFISRMSTYMDRRPWI
jgi:hypothetical protein